jgi:hypothetical protein
VSAALRLIPNIGGEEARPSPPPPAAITLARLWWLLFPHATPALDGAPPAAWPDALGEPVSSAAFAWLDGAVDAVAWLNDAAAEAAARRAGLRLAGPTPERVRAVHDKAFAVELSLAQGLMPHCLRPLVHVYAPEALLDADAAVRDVRARVTAWPAWTGGRFTLKPRIGGSGRGRFGGVCASLEAAALARALPRLARQGGAILEPWLARRADFSVQLHIARDATLTLLGTLEQGLSPGGTIRAHMGVLDHRARVVSGAACEDARIEAASALARAAAARGYTGPCSVDSFWFDGPDGPALRAALEFNARFSVGTLALGLLRRAWPLLPASLLPQPGQRRGLGFGLDAPPGGWPQSAADVWTLSLAQPGESLRPALVVARDPDALRARLAPRE